MPSRQRRVNELGKQAKKCQSIVFMFSAATPTSATPTKDVESDTEDRPRPVSPFLFLQSPCTPTSLDAGIHSNLFNSRQPACKRRLEDPGSDTEMTPRKRHASGHSLGFRTDWTTDRPWLYSKTICDSEGDESYMVMLCHLCEKHQTSSVNGTTVWTNEGCRTLRLDKVRDHEKSVQHKMSISMEDAKSSGADQATSISNATELAVRDAMKVLFYLVQNNLSMDLFSSMVDMCIDVGSPSLAKLRLAKNASYTSWDIVQELLSILSLEVREKVLEEVRASPCYGLMVDEVCDIVSHKHMAMCSQHINSDGEVTISFLSDPLLRDGKAATITEKITDELSTLGLEVKKMTGFASDGASVFTGKHNGVGAKLKVATPGLVTNHCKDHRLALACRDSFNDIKDAQKVDETLDRLHKYYKYSTVHTASLQEVQKAFGEPTLCSKQAKHHRWLSHSRAVTSIVRSYKSLIADLERSTISGDAVGNGILKRLKDPAVFQTIFFLADVLPHLSILSLFFQKQAVNMGMVGAVVQKTLTSLKMRGQDDGPWLRKMSSILSDCGVDNPDVKARDHFRNKIREPFIAKLMDNVGIRFQDTEIMDNLAILDITALAEPFSFHGMTEIEALASHFDIEEETLVLEWNYFLHFITQRDGNGRDILSCLKLFHGKDDMGLKAIYPNISSLVAKACVIPLSAAEVERVFSQVKLIKTAHRNRMSQATLNHLLMIKLNCGQDLFESLLSTVVKKWLGDKNRRLPCIIAKQ